MDNIICGVAAFLGVVFIIFLFVIGIIIFIVLLLLIGAGE